MKPFWICFVLAGALGTAAAWGINYTRYVAYEAYLGPIKVGGDITAVNVTDAYILSKEDGKLPEVEVDGELTYDFGVMEPNSEGEHVFVVRNVGNDDLTLQLGASSCKCTLGELAKESLAPGEETEIKLSWKIATYEKEFSQVAQIITNDPGRTVLSLKIVGKVVGSFELVPEVWAFGQVASGEGFEVGGLVYSYLDQKIKPMAPQFSSGRMNQLAEIDIEEVDVAELDDLAGGKSPTQAFRVTADLRPGLAQGAVSQNLNFRFLLLDEKGMPIIDTSEIDPADPASGPTSQIGIPVRGSVIGVLSLLENSRISRIDNGYIFDIGRIGPEDPLTHKALIVLKGEDRDSIDLKVTQTSPDGVLKATIGEAMGRGSMTLIPLEIELTPGEELIERLGKSKADYGIVMVGSDNPKVSEMRIGVKFALSPRP